MIEVNVRLVYSRKHS